MKILIRSLSFGSLMGFAGLSAQTATDPNEGSRLQYSPVQNIWQFQWHGKARRTYFIQRSDDFIDWDYLPVVKRGAGETLSLGLSSNATRNFWRLNFSTSSIYNDDVDADGLSDVDELAFGRNPFKADALSTGLPDGWAVAHGGRISVYPTEIRETLIAPQSFIRPIFISNDTAQAVDFQIGVAGQIIGEIPVYSAADSLTGNPVYTWTDISTTGTKLTAISAADDASQVIPLTQFSFFFFGQSHRVIHASSNGLLSLGSANSAYSNQPVQSAGNTSPIIAGFWDDLDTKASGDVYYQELADRLIVQYQQVGFHSSAGAVTFQIVLHSHGAIDLFYKEIIGNAQSATVGIANTAGTGQGLQIAYNQAYITNGLAVRVAPDVFVDPSLASGTVPAHSILRVNLGLNALSSMLAGFHNATLSVTFNRADTSVWRVPVTLQIPDTCQPIITLSEPVNTRRLD